MDLYDTRGQIPAIKALQDVSDFATNMREQLAGLTLDELAPVLEGFVCGLNGRPLRIQLGERSCTDTESISLPAVVAGLPEKSDNFRLFKAIVVHQWAQNWYGTWRGGVLLEAYDQGRILEADLARLHALETRKCARGFALSSPRITLGRGRRSAT